MTRLETWKDEIGNTTVPESLQQQYNTITLFTRTLQVQFLYRLFFLLRFFLPKIIGGKPGPQGPFPRFATSKESILDIKTYYKLTEIFQYTHFTSCHPPGIKRGFIKGKAMRLLRPNSSNTTFEDNLVLLTGLIM